jgi:hypothetical protein
MTSAQTRLERDKYEQKVIDHLKELIALAGKLHFCLQIIHFIISSFLQ